MPFPSSPPNGAGFALPDPSATHPLILPDGSPHLGTVYLRNVIAQDNFSVGVHSYASDFDPPESWAARLAPYLFPGVPGTLRIGRFCQIAQGVRFITAAANHATDGVSTFPFRAFDAATREGYHPDCRDTYVGDDVWLGFGAMVLSGAKIGSGSIIGAGSVVRGEIPPYSVVTGNPGQILRRRFSTGDIDRLMTLAWWDWPDRVISTHHAAIVAADIDRLEKIAARL